MIVNKTDLLLHTNINSKLDEKIVVDGKLANGVEGFCQLIIKNGFVFLEMNTNISIGLQRGKNLASFSEYSIHAHFSCITNNNGVGSPTTTTPFSLDTAGNLICLIGSGMVYAARFSGCIGYLNI